MKKAYLIIIYSLFLFSCLDPSKKIIKIIEIAGENKIELEKVIEYYQKSDDPDKVKAVYFLIENMINKHSYDGPTVKNFDAIFDILDSLHRNNVKIGTTSPLVQHKWDSLVRLYGSPKGNIAEKLNDLQNIKSEYLIEQIDQSFKVWREIEWAKELSFEEFCEYILPYRMGNERLEPWKKDLFANYKTFRDTVKAKNRFEFATALNYNLQSVVYTNHTMWSYPFGIPVSKMEKGKRGACQHVVSYTAMVMRANGLPVSIDKVVLWGNRAGGHEWNTLLMENGEFYPFDAARGPLEGKETFIYKFAKAYRESFEYNNDLFPKNINDIPPSLIDVSRIDVTDEYTQTYDIDVPLKYEPKGKKEYAIICSFDNANWAPQDWGKIEKNKASFKNMGSDVVYLAMYYNEGSYYPASYPFILTKDGKLNYLNSDSNDKQDMVLLRKYPIFKTQITHLSRVIGGRFQGANHPDFRDSVNLFTITEMPKKMEEVEIDNPKSFRYIRYVSPDNAAATIAELEFYTEDQSKPKKLEGKIIGTMTKTEYPLQNAFDGDLGTYYNSMNNKPNSWIGLDLLKPQRIAKIRYCPQNDTNFIIVGNTYELRYWDKNQWVSMGKQVATDQVINYANVPADRLYILHNLSGGKEERIFTYEDGKQLWW